MGRPRVAIDRERLAAMLRQGVSEADIAKAMGVGQSTIGRARRALAAPAVAGGRAPSASGEEIPADVASIDGLLAIVLRNIEDADAHGAYATLGNLIGKATALHAARRRALPPPEADLDASPDMLLAKQKAREAFHRLLEQCDAGKY